MDASPDTQKAPDARFPAVQFGLLGQLGLLWSLWVLRLLHLEGKTENKFDSGFKLLYSMIFEVQVNFTIGAKPRIKKNKTKN